MSGMVNKVKAKVEEVLHKDSTHTTGTHTTGTHTGTHTAGTHTGTHTTGGYGSTNAGPHDSNMANKLDPRVDSDRDGKNFAQHEATGHGTTGTGIGHSSHNPGVGHTTGGYGSNTGGYGSTNAGPHDSNMANKLDPRVDSDRDGKNVAQREAAYGTNTHTGGVGGAHHGTHTGTTGGYGSTNAGPHDSNVMNKLDPRVDSDRDGQHPGQAQAQGYSSGGTGAYGSNTTGGGLGSHSGHTHGSTNAGPHSSNLANKLDPRVDSDRDGANVGQGRY